MKKAFLLSLCCVAIAPASAFAPQRVAEERLAAELQLQLAQRAIAICARGGAQVAVAIAGPDRVVRTLVSHDGANPVAIETARRKAISAALVGYPTSGLAKAAREAPAYVEMLRSVEPMLLTLGGGVPIRAKGVLLGGLGVGGAAGPEADEACARQALAEVLADAGE